MIERVHRYKEKEPLFESSGVEKEIASTLDRRVDLPSGGYLVFDYAEAFTVIDVNTGRFVGSRSKNSNQRLEDTITKNNLEAVKEVVRQLRLRDIGGIIVIDFIDMANPKNRASVEDALRAELERDRTKTYVVEISPLGLVEMTRQNVTDGPREILTRKCPTCAGDGIVVSDQTMAMQLERKLRLLASPGNRVQAYTIAVHPRMLPLLAGPGGARLAAIEEAARRRFFLVPAEGHVHIDQFEVLAEGKLVDLQPESPIAEGSTVELKLVEVGLHDATAGAGKLDGLDVIVADAAKLVGKKATVTIGRVLAGQAFATLVDAGETVEEPITFESEAEKPTRAPARRKTAPAPLRRRRPTTPSAGDDETTSSSKIGLEISTSRRSRRRARGRRRSGSGPEGVETEGGVAPKKRTRRGSRGGRRRRKPAGAGAGEPATESHGEAEPEDDTRRENCPPLRPSPRWKPAKRRSRPPSQPASSLHAAAGRLRRSTSRMETERPARASRSSTRRSPTSSRRRASPLRTALSPSARTPRGDNRPPRRRSGRAAAAAAARTVARSLRGPGARWLEHEAGSADGDASEEVRVSREQRHGPPEQEPVAVDEGPASDESPSTPTARSAPRSASTLREHGRRAAPRGRRAGPEDYVPMSQWLDDFDRR